MHVTDTAQRDEPVVADQAFVALPLAGFGRRFVALLIDVFVTLVLVWLFLIVAAFVLGLFGYSTRAGDVELWNQYRENPETGLRIMTALGYIVYFTFMEARRGATFGKRLLRLQVVTEAGEPIGWGASLVRNLLRPVDVLGGFLIALVSWRRQRLGDLAAKTVVVRA